MTKTVLTWINERLELLQESIKEYKPNSLSASHIEGQIMSLKYLKDAIIHSDVM